MKQKKLKIRELTDEEQKEIDEWVDIYGNDGLSEEEIEKINQEHIKYAEKND